MAPNDKSASTNTKNTPVAKVVTPVKKKANPSSTSPVVHLSPYNNPSKVKDNPLKKSRGSIKSFLYSIQIRHPTVGLLNTSMMQKSSSKVYLTGKMKLPTLAKRSSNHLVILQYIG